MTISAGGASADVTVSPTLAPGTILWSNPGDGSGVKKIVPAVPSSTGVADVFAFQNDGTLQAITSDGTTAWTATATYSPWNPSALPDFQGGLVVSNFDSNTNSYSITRLDGVTGQPYPSYNLGPYHNLLWSLAHPDGTVFVVENDSGGATSVVGIDPTTGTQTFSLPVLDANNAPISISGPSGIDFIPPIIAGDGYAYLAYVYRNNPCDGIQNLALLRISTAGASTNIPVLSRQTHDGCEWEGVLANIITNADTGVLLSWSATDFVQSGPYAITFGTAIVTGTSVSMVNGPLLPGQSPVTPVLQSQDGSYIGTAEVSLSPTTSQANMVAFDQTGNIHWSVPGNWQPQIATDDGGVIATQLDANNNPIATITFDQNGNATGQLGAFGTQAWTGNAYQVGSVDQFLTNAVNLAVSFWSSVRGNPSGNGAANLPAAKAVQQLISQIATNYSNPPQNAGWENKTPPNQCNQFVHDVLVQAGTQAPQSLGTRFRYSYPRIAYYLGFTSTASYPASAGDWAFPHTTMKCWQNLEVPATRLGGYPADVSRAGDVIGEDINYSDASGHVGIVVGPQQTASADSAAACMSNGTILPEIIDITNYGFRPDGAVQTNALGQVCSTHGWKSHAVVKRFVCQ